MAAGHVMEVVCSSLGYPRRGWTTIGSDDLDASLSKRWAALRPRALLSASFLPNNFRAFGTPSLGCRARGAHLGSPPAEPLEISY